MLALILRYGVIAGLIIGIPMVWRVLSVKPGEYRVAGMLVTYLVMIVALTAVFLGIKAYRDKVLGGVVRFLPALGVGLGISAVASIVYVIAWEVSTRVQQLRLPRPLQGLHGGSRPRPRAASGAEVNQAIADAEAFAKMYVNPLYRLPMMFVEMFPVGVLISLISAAVLRNPRVLPARALSYWQKGVARWFRAQRSSGIASHYRVPVARHLHRRRCGSARRRRRARRPASAVHARSRAPARAG